MPGKVQHTHRSVMHGVIDKTNTLIVVAVSVAVFVVVFCSFAVKALVSQSLYQGRVIDAKKQALTTLRENKIAADQLRSAYVIFEDAAINMLGGNPNGSGPLDGDNARLVLDALPSVNDYPALSSSIEKILVDGGYGILSIGGSDDADVSSADTGVVTASPQPVEVLYPVTVDASPEKTLALLQTLERSIRPFSVTTLSISGQGESLSTSVVLKTYYQPPSGLQVSTKEVK